MGDGLQEFKGRGANSVSEGNLPPPAPGEGGLGESQGSGARTALCGQLLASLPPPGSVQARFSQVLDHLPRLADDIIVAPLNSLRSPGKTFKQTSCNLEAHCATTIREE